MAAKSEEAAHGAMHLEGSNKKIALLISVIALFLAFSETLGKSAQTNAISFNVEASNLWAFFQAKTIRMTTMATAVIFAHADDPFGVKEKPLLFLLIFALLFVFGSGRYSIDRILERGRFGNQ